MGGAVTGTWQAEPITPSSIGLFFKTFCPYGLRTAAMRPGYGLAEHTVYVSDSGTVVRMVNKEQLEVHHAIVDLCEPMPVGELLRTSTVCLCVVYRAVLS